MGAGMSDDQKPYDASDPEQVRGRKEKQRRRDLLKKAALRGLMNTAEGRTWMWDVLERCGVYQLSYALGSDALAAVFREGRRDIGNFLIGEINRIDGGPEMYMTMAVENQTKEKEA